MQPFVPVHSATLAHHMLVMCPLIHPPHPSLSHRPHPAPLQQTQQRSLITPHHLKAHPSAPAAFFHRRHPHPHTIALFFAPNAHLCPHLVKRYRRHRRPSTCVFIAHCAHPFTSNRLSSEATTHRCNALAHYTCRRRQALDFKAHLRRLPLGNLTSLSMLGVRRLLPLAITAFVHLMTTGMSVFGRPIEPQRQHLTSCRYTLARAPCIAS